jgi:uncharacterized protein (TIGR00266 family)
MRNQHEVEFRICGEDLQYVEIGLRSNESIIAEAGNLMMMESDIHMETILGDGSDARNGLFGKLVSAGKRWLSGEGLYLTVFTNLSDQQEKRHVLFSAPYPGKIIPLDLAELGGKIICQKDSFLCATKGVSIGIEYQRRRTKKSFMEKNFILQKLEGDGLVFIHSGGALYKKVLFPDEQLRIDQSCLVAMTKNVLYRTEYAGSIKATLFGGEGLYITELTGPGTVWVQSLPFRRLARRVYDEVGSERNTHTDLDLIDD